MTNDVDEFVRTYRIQSGGFCNQHPAGAMKQLSSSFEQEIKVEIKQKKKRTILRTANKKCGLILLLFFFFAADAAALHLLRGAVHEWLLYQLNNQPEHNNGHPYLGTSCRPQRGIRISDAGGDGSERVAGVGVGVIHI